MNKFITEANMGELPTVVRLRQVGDGVEVIVGCQRIATIFPLAVPTPEPRARNCQIILDGNGLRYSKMEWCLEPTGTKP